MSSARLETHESVERLAPEWDELADRVGAAPWLRPGWVAAWLESFGAGSLELLVLRRNGRLAAVAPLERAPGRLRSTTNWHTPAYRLLAETDAGEELALALFRRRVRQVSLRFVPGRDVETLAAAARAAGRGLLVRTLERSPFVALDGGWPAYESGLPRKLAGELRRRRRRLEERGRLSLAVEEGGERLDALLEEGFRVEAAGWKGDDGSAIASDPATRRFYVAVARWAASRGWLRLAFLRHDDRAIAFDYALEWGGAHYLLKTGYEPEYRAFAPGLVLRHDMIRRAFETGLSTYEFLGADEPWKLTWAPATRSLLHVQAFTRTPLGAAEHAAYALGRPLLRRLRALRR